MEAEQRRAAKEQMIALMQAGHRWQEAAAQAGIQVSRSTAFQERFGIQISLGYLNQVRARLGLGRRTQEAGKKLEASSPVELQWQEGAGGLLLVAAAEETGPLSTMETAVSACTPRADSRLAHLSARSRHMLVRTLLFLGAVGLDRTWDRSRYTGDGLGVLTGRARAYGYFHTERFLSQVAQADGADTFTDGLAQWTARLWNLPAASTQEVEPLYYIDGHRKPVYADALIPRGLIGNSGKILGCRALVLLHDEQGRPIGTRSAGQAHPRGSSGLLCLTASRSTWSIPSVAGGPRA
jgi:hypothetical protein